MNHAWIFSTSWTSPLSVSPAALVVWVALERRWPRKLALNNKARHRSRNMPKHDVSKFPSFFCHSEKTMDGAMDGASVFLLLRSSQFWASKERFWRCSLKALWKAAPSWTWSKAAVQLPREKTGTGSNIGSRENLRHGYGIDIIYIYIYDMIKHHQQPANTVGILSCRLLVLSHWQPGGPA